MIEMFDNISWQSVLSFDEHLNDLVEVVWTDVKDFNHPWEGPDMEKTQEKNKITVRESINLLSYNDH